MKNVLISAVLLMASASVNAFWFGENDAQYDSWNNATTNAYTVGESNASASFSMSVNANGNADIDGNTHLTGINKLHNQAQNRPYYHNYQRYDFNSN